MTDKINWEQISEPLKLLDSDVMDIYRRIPTVNDDGTMGDAIEEIPIYSNINCHISFTKSDKSIPNTNSTQYTEYRLQINCPLDVDIQKNDYIEARKLSNTGEIIKIYKGILGMPVRTQTRQFAQFEMRLDI